MIDKILTPKQEGFVKDYVATGNKGRSVMNNYDVDDISVASQMGTELTRKPHVERAIIKLMENKDLGLDDKSLLGKHVALLNKEEVIVKNNNKTGEIEVIPTGQIDRTAVKDALDMAYKIKGHYTNDKKESEKPINIAVILNNYE